MDFSLFNDSIHDVNTPSTNLNAALIINFPQ